MKKKDAEVVVVGAGVVGASVAYHLAARGCRKVMVFERTRDLGHGSTGRATGGFRAQFATPVNVQLSLLSREKLLRFPAEVGVEPGYEQRGYLFLARSGAELEALRAAQAVQKACGLEEARMVSPSDIRALNPWVLQEGLVGGAFCPTDGFVRPTEIMRGYAEAAARLGVSFFLNVEVTGFRKDKSGQIAGVELSDGAVVNTNHVVNAAGPWAAEVARLAGVGLPVVPLCRQVALTQPFPHLPEEMPMTIFVEDGFHFRVRDGRVMLLWPDAPCAADPFDTTFRDEWLSEVVRRARERVPVLREVEIDRPNCRAGLYEMSPDKHAILGPPPEVENFYLANGSSGHGVMHAPALGQLLAEIILDGRATTLDVSALRPTRFAEGEPNVSSEFL
ncbi:MAG TPA: FAD-dependent oxidoreductase [Pyrinomonadaceae bacterium]|nr:FAD-dependent oxidoreductase [Pyrinomonadaceae bacterium]